MTVLILVILREDAIILKIDIIIRVELLIVMGKVLLIIIQ